MPTEPGWLSVAAHSTRRCVPGEIATRVVGIALLGVGSAPARAITGDLRHVAAARDTGSSRWMSRAHRKPAKFRRPSCQQTTSPSSVVPEARRPSSSGKRRDRSLP